jgi:hypothetical protein
LIKAHSISEDLVAAQAIVCEFPQAKMLDKADLAHYIYIEATAMDQLGRDKEDILVKLD